MASIEEIEKFLYDIREKMRFFDIVFRNREKNLRTLQILDLIPAERIEIIKALTYKNYYCGPKIDTEDPRMPDYFEFGVQIKGEPVYIKLNRGLPNKAVDCASFHIAERTITYHYT